MWVRLRQPLLAGEPTSPVQRAVISADFGNAIGSIVDMQRWSFINAELTVHLFREAVGDWICLESLMRAGDEGIGAVATQLRDEHGPIGSAAQSLLIERR